MIRNKTIKEIEEMAAITLLTLTELSQYQGYAGLSVFDGGVSENGGMFSLSINLERDGLIMKQENVDFDELLAFITNHLKDPYKQTIKYRARPRRAYWNKVILGQKK